MCAQGCMYCDSNQNCVFCDTLTNYYLNFNTCVAYDGNNCQRNDQNDVCLLCNQGYYFNTTIMKCSQVPTTMIISYCN